MSRPKKIGLDYFPVDVKFDRKIEAIEHLFGNDGFVWIIKFWQEAYQTEFGELNLCGLFGELLANNCRITTELQEKIIKSSLEIKLIQKTDKGLYTSTGIKKRIVAVSSERKKAIERKKRNKKRNINKRKEKESKTSPDCSANNLMPLNRVKNADKKKTEKNKFDSPSIEEVIKYFLENGYPKSLGEEFWKYYQEGNPPWYDQHGSPVRSWKQKARVVWFKPEKQTQNKTTSSLYEKL